MVFTTLPCSKTRSGVYLESFSPRRSTSLLSYCSTLPPIYFAVISPCHLGALEDKCNFLYCEYFVTHPENFSPIVTKGFWLLWWNDLLPAALPIYLLFVLLKHRFLPYPSLSELKQHREEIHEADHFGEQLYRRLSTNSFGIKDAWRLGNLVVFPFEEKSVFGNTRTHPPGDGSEPTDTDGPSDSDEIQRLKRLCLYMMNETADFHERAKK